MIVLLVIVGLVFFIQLGKILYSFILNKVREYKLNEGRILLSSIGKNVAKEDIFVIIKYNEFTNEDAAKIMSTIYKNFGTTYKIEIALKS